MNKLKPIYTEDLAVILNWMDQEVLRISREYGSNIANGEIKEYEELVYNIRCLLIGTKQVGFCIIDKEEDPC